MPEPSDANSGETQFRSDRLSEIRSRLETKLEEESVLAYPTIQYLFSEVGRSWTRLDPRELQFALRLIVAGWRAQRTACAEALPGVYVYQGSPRADSQLQGILAARTKEAQLLSLASEVGSGRSLALANEVTGALELEGQITAVDQQMTEGIGGSAIWDASGAQFSLKLPSGSRARVWLTMNVRWVFPDSAGLWRHLVHAHSLGERPVVIARKIAVATFPLLKRMGALGFQLHHCFVPKLPTLRISRRALDNGPPLRAAADAREHVVITDLITEHLNNEPAAIDRLSDALQMAEELGLVNDANSQRAFALRQWGDSSPVAMPAQWKAQITRYNRWMSRSGDEP